MRHLLALALPLLALAACASPAQRIATTLSGYGVPPAQARCMGDKLQSRLSLGQLRRLDEISRLDSQRLGKMSLSDIAAKLTDPRDAELAAEFLRAGVGCAF